MRETGAAHLVWPSTASLRHALALPLLHCLAVVHVAVSTVAIIRTLDSLTVEVHRFSQRHTIWVPSQRDTWRDYRKTERTLTTWHAGFQALQARIAADAQVIETTLAEELVLPSHASAPPAEARSSSDPVISLESATPESTAAALPADKTPSSSLAQRLDAARARAAAKRAGTHATGNAATDQVSSDASTVASPADERLEVAEHVEAARGAALRAAASRRYERVGLGMSMDTAHVDAHWLAAFLVLYVLLLTCAYATQSVLMASLAMAASTLVLLVLYRAKSLNDSLAAAVGSLRVAQVSLAGLFSAYESKEMVAQSLCLRKLDIIASWWEGHGTGVRLPLPVLGVITVNTNLLLSVTVPNVLGLVQVVIGVGWKRGLAMSSQAARAASTPNSHARTALGAAKLPLASGQQPDERAADDSRGGQTPAALPEHSTARPTSHPGSPLYHTGSHGTPGLRHRAAASGSPR